MQLATGVVGALIDQHLAALTVEGEGVFEQQPVDAIDTVLAMPFGIGLPDDGGEHVVVPGRGETLRLQPCIPLSHRLRPVHRVQ